MYLNEKEYKIIPLPKDKWEGVPIPMRYTTDEFYDIQIIRESDGYTMRMRRQKADPPISHFPEEYDFPDKLYQPHWENASAWGIVDEESGELIACIETCPEEWSNRLIVTEMWVHESLRRRGIAHELMKIAKNEAKTDARRAIILETQSCNAGAISFYLSEGFELMGFDSCCYANDDIQRREVRIDMGLFIE